MATPTDIAMPVLPEDFRGPGLRVRFKRIRGVTAKGVLESALYLPVVLNDFSFEETADHRDYTTVSAGEFSVPAPGPASARMLRTTSLETLTLDWYRFARWLVARGRDPQEVRAELFRIMRSRTPFELLAALDVHSGPEELRMNATLRGISRVLRPGEADTRYYTLDVKEWRDNAVKRRGQGSSGRLPTTAKLTAQTTLSSLSKHFYGSGASWRLIAAANGIKSWGASTPLVESKRFKVGDKVKIPKPETASI